MQVRVRAGGRAVLECEAEGDKPLSLHWWRNNSRLERKDGPRYSII